MQLNSALTVINAVCYERYIFLVILLHSRNRKERDRLQYRRTWGGGGNTEIDLKLIASE
jgi:hypothetical protein